MTTVSSSPPFALRLHRVLDAAQSSHGVPHQDYAQYHAYCTAKLSRLRHHRDVRGQLTHNVKFVSQDSTTTSSGGQPTSKRRHAYSGARDLNAVEHENVVWVLLFQAERSWAGACEKQTSATAPKRHVQAQRRLNKATQHASRLRQVAQRLCDATCVTECEAYWHWMQGNVELEHKHYKEAFQHYNAAMQTLQQMANVDKDDDITLADLWSTRAETVLKPLARYCQYEAHDASLQLADAAATSNTICNNKDSIRLEFRGRSISLDAFQQLAVLYLKMEPLLSSMQTLDEAASLQLGSALDDAVQAVHAELAHYHALASGPAVLAKRSDLQTLQTYLEFQQHTLARLQHEARLPAGTTVAEQVHVYETLWKNVQATAALFDDEVDLDNDDDWLHTQAHVLRIRAHKVGARAAWYETSHTATSTEVLALVTHGQRLQRRALEEVQACDMEPVYAHKLEQLGQELAALECRVQATRYLTMQQQQKDHEHDDGRVADAMARAHVTDRPLWLRLQDWDAGPKIADDDPMLLYPLPCKPAFYDIAYQYVMNPAPARQVLQDFVQQHESAATAQKGKGLLGWLRG